jgi:hypothetical protein
MAVCSGGSGFAENESLQGRWFAWAASRASARRHSDDVPEPAGPLSTVRATAFSGSAPEPQSVRLAAKPWPSSGRARILSISNQNSFCSRSERAGAVEMSGLFPVDFTSSRFPDPQFEDRTEDPQKTAWAAYCEALRAALDRYDAEKLKARSEYMKNRRGYLSGSILRPTLKQLMYVWPTDAQLAEFDECEVGQLAEYEKMVFHAARQYTRSERDARLAYWKAIEAPTRSV